MQLGKTSGCSVITLIFFMLDDKLQVAVTSSSSPRGWACKHYLPLGEHFQSQGNCTGCLVGGNVSPTISYLDWLKSLSDRTCPRCVPLQLSCLVSGCVLVIFLHKSRAGEPLCYSMLNCHPTAITWLFMGVRISNSNLWGSDWSLVPIFEAIKGMRSQIQCTRLLSPTTVFPSETVALYKPLCMCMTSTAVCVRV